MTRLLTFLLTLAIGWSACAATWTKTFSWRQTQGSTNFANILEYGIQSPDECVTNVGTATNVTLQLPPGTVKFLVCSEVYDAPGGIQTIWDGQIGQAQSPPMLTDVWHSLLTNGVANWTWVDVQPKGFVFYRSELNGYFAVLMTNQNLKATNGWGVFQTRLLPTNFTGTLSQKIWTSNYFIYAD